MYQYKARLKSSNKIIHEAHTVEEIENAIKHFRRMQKRGLHTRANEQIEIIHVKRNKIFGKRQAKETILKIV